MNNLEQTLQQILEKALNVAEKTGEFVIDQAPLLLQEFYMWHIAQRIVFMSVGLLIFIVLNKCSNFFGRKEPHSYNYESYGDKRKVDFVLHCGRYFDPTEDWQIGRYIFRYSSWIIPSIIVLINLYKIVFILVAPKLYLIEYFIK